MNLSFTYTLKADDRKMESLFLTFLSLTKNRGRLMTFVYLLCFIAWTLAGTFLLDAVGILLSGLDMPHIHSFYLVFAWFVKLCMPFVLFLCMPYLYQWIYLRKTLPQATEYGQSLAFHSCEFTDSGIKVYDTKTTQYFDWDQILSARFFEKRVILVPTNKVPIVIPKETIGADFRVICDVLRKQVFLKHNGWTPFVS